MRLVSLPRRRQGPRQRAADRAAGTDFGFVGLIDEIRISREVLYVADFTVPHAPFEKTAGTIALWHFDEGAGDTAMDSAGGHHAKAPAPATRPTWRAVPCVSDFRP